MTINEITDRILGAAVEVHTRLGPGLLESVYRVCLARELRKRGLRVLEEVRTPVVWDGEELDASYRIDLVVEDRVVVEVKAARALDPVFTAQTLTYLRVGNYEVGLLSNFHTSYLGQGAIKRLVNRYTGPLPGSKR
jgi:GxxExxY protein